MDILIAATALHHDLTLFHALAAALKETTGTYPFRPNQCANFILSAVYMPLLRAALAEREGNPAVFIAWYDYASGIVEVAGELCMAEAAQTGKATVFTQHGIDKTLEGFSQPMPSSFYETAYTLNREKDRKGGQLLRQDPTGNTLIAAVVAEIRAEADHTALSNGIKRIPTYQQPQLFLAGAEYAQRVYTALYPLSQ